MILLYFVMALFGALFIAAGYQALRNYSGGSARLSVLLQDVLFLTLNTFVLGSLGGALLKFYQNSDGRILWLGLMELPVLAGLVTLGNYLVFLVLDRLLPRAKMGTYPPPLATALFLLALFVGAGYASYVTTR